MIQLQKQQIAKEIALLSQGSSQGMVAARAGVSTATVSQIINSNWKRIAPDMWRKVSVALHIDWRWHHADTTNSKHLTDLLTAAQARSMAIGIAHEAGAGKSHAYKRYAKAHKNVIYLECKNYWTKKSFVKALLAASGHRSTLTTEQMIERFIDLVMKMENPLIIFDQIDKLKNSQLDLFMDFYNAFPHCGFIVSGVPALEKRILRGVKYDKVGYREFFSRIGRKFVPLTPVSSEDVETVCRANGLTDLERINEIYNTCEGDFRRVRRAVEQYFLLKPKKQPHA